MNKSLIIEEVSRMRTLMGLSNKNVMNLLKEDTGSVIQKFFTELAQAIGKGDDVLAAKIINDFRTTNPNEAKIFDEWMGGSKAMKYGNDVIYTLADLAKLGSVKAFTTFLQTVTKNSDSFLATLSKNVSSLKLLPLPSGISPGQIMDDLIALDGVPEFIKQYLRDVKSGNLGKYSADEIKGLNASLIRASQDATGGMTATQKKAVGEFVGDLEEVAKEVEEAEIKITGSKRKTSSWDPTEGAEYIDFEDISDEIGFDAGTAGREAGGEAGGEAGTAGRTGGEAGGEAGTAGRTGGEDSKWSAFVDESGDVDTAGLKKESGYDDALKKYSDLYSKGRSLFEVELGKLRRKVLRAKKGEIDFTSAELALIDVAVEKGVINMNDPIIKTLRGEILENPTIREIINLEELYKIHKEEMGGDAMKISSFYAKNGLKEPSWLKTLAAKGVATVDKVLTAFQTAITTIKNFQSASIKELMGAVFTCFWIIGLVGGGTIGIGVLIFKSLTDSIESVDAVTKTKIKENLKTFFAYSNPEVVSGQSTFNIYNSSIQNNTNLMYLKTPPGVSFEGVNVDKNEFVLDSPLYLYDDKGQLVGKPTRFRMVSDDSKILPGNTTISKPHYLVVLGTVMAQNTTPVTKGLGTEVGAQKFISGINDDLTIIPNTFTLEKIESDGTELWDMKLSNKQAPNAQPASLKLKFNPQTTTWSK